MATGKFMKSGGMAALVAGLAVLALPASAQAQDRGQGRWNRGGGEATGQNNNPGGWRGGDNNGGGWRGRDSKGANDGAANDGANAGGGRRSFRNDGPAATPAPAPQPQAQVQAPRNWSRGDGSGWRGRGANTAQVAPAPEAQVQNDRRGWSGGGSQWQGRNRDIAAGNRNDARGRDDVARWRGNDANRWTGNDANRWRGNDDNRWRGDRQNYAGNRAGNWNRDWRRDDRYDWRGYRNSNRNTYRLGAYYAPYRNYSYRRLSAGFYLDTLFFGSRYWIDDPWQYRLPPAYGPYRWVRYYDDALLVDTYSGEVVDVIYSFFW